MTKQLLLIAMLWVTTAPTVAAQVTPRALAVTGSGEVRGVLSDYGVFLQRPEGWRWSCASTLGIEARGLVAVGPERLMAWGPGGVVSSDADRGCGWRAMAGVAGLRPIVAVHQPSVGGLDAIFAIGGEALQKIAVTSDGGMTSALSDGLSLAQFEVLGMAGLNDRVVIVAEHTTTGDVSMWRSEDLGETWTERQDVAAENPPVPLGLFEDGAVFGLQGAVLGRLETSGWVALKTFARPPNVTPDGLGGAMIAAGAEGLWYLGAEGLEQRDEGAWEAAAVAGGWVFLAAIASNDGASWVFRDVVSGSSAPVEVTALKADIPHPAVCSAALGGECAADRGLLEAALGVDPKPDWVAPPPGVSEGCEMAPRGRFAPWWLVALLLWTVLGRRRKLQAS